MLALRVASPVAKAESAARLARARRPSEPPTWQRPALTLGRADDRLEADAAAVAERLTRVCASPAPAAPDARAPAAPAVVQEALRSPGQPLDRATRAFMEPRLGHDFSRIRIHADPAAARSAPAIGARAYAAGAHIVFAPGQYAPATPQGRALLAHELTHCVQQPGAARVVRRQPAKDPAPTAGPNAAPARLTPDDWLGALEIFRLRSPREFVIFLAKNESFFYPFLQPYGFHGSWVKDEDYLADFDAAIVRWPKRAEYQRGVVAAKPPPRRQTREERQYENAQMLVVEYNRHGHARSQVNDDLESSGLIDDLERHGFDKAGRWSRTDSEVYQQRAITALNAYIYRYRAAHGLGTGPSVGVPAEGALDIEFYRVWLEGLQAVTSSFLGAVSAGVAMQFTDDPRKITAAAEFGATIEGMGTAHVLGRGSGTPEVVTRRNVPPVPRSRYSGAQPLEPVRDPAKVAGPPVRDPLPPPRTEPLTPQSPQPPKPSPVVNVAPASPQVVAPATTAVNPKSFSMRAPPGGGDRAGMASTAKTLTPFKPSTPVVEVLPRSTVPMSDFEPPEPGHYIRRKPPSAPTQAQIWARAGHTTDGRLRDANTGRALEDGEAVWGHAPNYQFKDMRDMAEKLKWTQEDFDKFFEDPNKWQVEYGPSNSSRVFDRIPRQRPIH